MIFDTHLLISQILYNSILKQMNFKLNRLAFAYGNIKPDLINKDINRSHTQYQSLFNVNKYAEELVKENISIEKFSTSLGVICHFACDYFCLYHRDGNENKGIFEHLIYELILHVKLVSLLLIGKLMLNNYGMHENRVVDIAFNLEKKYKSESKSLTKDITYALFAASQISTLIVGSSQIYFEQMESNILDEYQLRKVNGGI
ncbi:MAG: zinc dependent phospholipase C family protein [Clostridiaceae bacterium]|nr:zinc dependent phospholipase C family protein [Clostridiaceae bacterium]